MKRIIGTVVALTAVLAFGTVSSAAIIVYNLAPNSTFNTASSLAPNPPGYFTSPLSAGSHIAINTDTNGDLVEGDVSVAGGTLYLNATTDLGPTYGTFTSHVTTAVSGGTGVLSGGSILWDALPGTSFDVDPASTFSCTGLICSILGISENTLYPISVYQAFTAAQGVVPVNPTALGTWLLGPHGFQATGIAVVGAVSGQPAQWYVFAGSTLPEPGTLALVLLGLGGLALRARRA